ncbi:MAG: thiamine-phosphate kinase [Lentimicrobiaceae bacterium]|nr:thiamine-phosphate kinase [Lentimicrobiaceae bacterium]MCO5265828.1 thiamine-phosphate kinase [Lentimicrobium sp.]
MTEHNIPNRTELSALGEFGLIDHLTAGIKPFNSSTLKGVGDDAAVIDNGENVTLVSKDLLIEGVHFDLTYMPLKHLGYKAAAVNISDIVAMNGTATQMLVGISVSNRFSVEALDELYAGIKMACNRYKVDLVGGDTTSSVSGLFISVTVLGQAKKDEVVYRSTAHDTDLICVSGDLGGAYMGLLLLEREKEVFKADPSMQPDLDGNDYVLERQLKPEPRTDILIKLKEAGVKPTAMIDISDGLASEILHIAHDSGLGCRIYENKIPIDVITAEVAQEFTLDPTTAAMNGGEDYELLFTINVNDFEKVKDIKGIHIIGHMTEKAEGEYLISNGGSLYPIDAQGFNHLRD